MFFLLTVLGGAVFCVLLLLLVSTLLWGLLSRVFKVSLTGKAVFITGCDTGIGHLLALRLCKRYGALVFAGCLTKEGAERLVKGSEGRIHAVSMDVTDQKSVEEAYAKVTSGLAGKPLHALVNNAGLSRGWFVEFTDMETFEKTMDVNYLGAVRVTKRFASLLVQSKGRVVTITSSLALVCLAGVGAYTASKYALQAFMSVLSMELDSFGVKFIEVCPGCTATPFLQSALDSAFASFESSDPQLQARYGGFKFLKKFKDLWSSIWIRCIQGSPDNVVSVLALSLSTRFPRCRYMVGMDAFLLWRVLGCLPEGIKCKLACGLGITNMPEKPIKVA